MRPLHFVYKLYHTLYRCDDSHCLDYYRHAALNLDPNKKSASSTLLRCLMDVANFRMIYLGLGLGEGPSISPGTVPLRP